MFWRKLFVALLLAFIATPAIGQSRLAWALKMEDRFFVETTNQVTQSVVLSGKNVTEETESTGLAAFRVISLAGDEVVLERTILTLRSKNQVRGAEDSDRVARHMDEVSDEVRKGLEGATFTITLSNNLDKLIKIEGLEERVKSVFASPLRRQAVVLEQKAEIANLFAAFLPEKMVRSGDSWTRKSALALGPMGSFAALGSFSDRGEEKLDARLVHRINGSWELMYSPPPKESGLPFQITASDMKSARAKGTYWFDQSLGRLSRANRQLSFKGVLSVQVQEHSLKIELAQQQSWSARFLEKNPLER